MSEVSPFSLIDYDKNKKHFCIHTVPFFSIPPVHWINHLHIFITIGVIGFYVCIFMIAVPPPCIFVKGSVT